MERITKREFLETLSNYTNGVKRFSSINLGELVFEEMSRGGLGIDHHPAVVADVNVDECYVEVIDVSSNNEIKRYENFLTEREIVNYSGSSITKVDLEKTREKYRDVIEQVLNKKS